MEFPKLTAVQPPSQAAADKIDVRAHNRERVHAKAEIVRAALMSSLTQDEASQIARNLGRMIEEVGLRLTGMANLARLVDDSTFSKQRQRYVRFDDDAHGPVARFGGRVFRKIAETLAVWTEPDDRELAKDVALQRLAFGVPRLQGLAGPTSPAARDASEAFGRLTNLLNIGVGQISRQYNLSQYFQTLIDSDLGLDENCRFSAEQVQDSFSTTRIFDDAVLSEVGGRIPRFLPRVRVATLYRRHVATTVMISDAELSAEESADPECLYRAGLRRIELEAEPLSGDAYPPAPRGWNKLKQEDVEVVYERLDVWLAIAPDDRADATRPALIFMSGESEPPEGDVWRSSEAFDRHANHCILYYNSVGEGDDVNCPGWPKSDSSLPKTPLPAILHLNDYDQDDPLAAILHHRGPGGATSVLELRAQVPPLTPIIWHRTDGWGSLLRFFNPDLESTLFQRCFLWNNNEKDYFYASPRPSTLNDTPILIRRFKDPETWSPGPMKSLGGALLRNLVSSTEDSVLTALRNSAERLRNAMDDFNAQGREEFERVYRSKVLRVDETSDGGQL